jgi:hypothetical protein
LQIKMLQDSASRFLKENSNTILTAAGVVGTVGTAVLAGRAGFKAAKIIEEKDYQPQEGSTGPVQGVMSTSDKVKAVWPQFIPPVATGTATIAAIIMANRLSAKEAAVLAAAYGVSKKELEEYKAKIAEKLSPTKAGQVKEEIAQDRVKENPPSSTIIVMADEVLCYDKPTDRYFKSTMEKIRRAELATNTEINRYGFAKARFFYDELEMEPTSWTSNAGWNRAIEVEISHALAKDERPCLTINFSRMPDPNYRMDYS